MNTEQEIQIALIEHSNRIPCERFRSSYKAGFMDAIKWYSDKQPSPDPSGEVMSLDLDNGTQKCCKCGGRTALVSGYWYYTPNQEPYENGIEEKSEVGEADAYMNGFVCDDCGTIQDVFVDEEKYKSALNEATNKYAALEQDLKYLQNLYDSEQRHSAAQEKSLQFYQKIADKFIALEQENEKLRGLIKELIPIAKDGHTLHIKNASHQDFLEDDKDLLNRATKALQQTDNDKTE